MKKIVAVTCVALLAVGCNREPSGPGAQISDKPVTTVPQMSPSPVSQAKLSDTVDIKFDFPHKLRYSRIRTKGNIIERQVLAELLEDDVASARTKLESFMKARGYRQTRQAEDRGGQRLSFIKQGAPSVVARLWPPGAGPVKLQNPGATGSLYLSWRLPNQ